MLELARTRVIPVTPATHMAGHAALQADIAVCGSGYQPKSDIDLWQAKLLTTVALVASQRLELADYLVNRLVPLLPVPLLLVNRAAHLLKVRQLSKEAYIKSTA